MEVVEIVGFGRVVGVFVMIFVADKAWAFLGVGVLVTVVYGMIMIVLEQSSRSIIMNKCISQLPSIILLIICCYYEKALRVYFLFAAGIEYLCIWLTVYDEILNKTLRNDIIAKKKLPLAEVLSWALNDVKSI